MMKQMDVTHANQPNPETSKPLWITPTLERLSLKEALSGGTTSFDGRTGNGATNLS
jgi:hypothetical protein